MNTITVDTFGYVPTEGMRVPEINDEYINSWFNKIRTSIVNTSVSYRLCRVMYNWFREIQKLRAENEALKMENKRLFKTIENLTVSHKPEIVVVNNDEWITSGNPGNNWRKIHEMGSL